MKNPEYYLVLALALFGAAYVLHYLGGTVAIAVNSPLAYLNGPSSLYPLTTVAIMVRSAALFVSYLIISELAEKKFALKTIVALIVGSLMELYAIQQLMTNGKITPIEWTLSISYAAVLLLPLAVIYLILAIYHGLHDKFIGTVKPLPGQNE